MTLPSHIIQNYSEYLSFRSFYTGQPLPANQVMPIANSNEALDYIKERLSKLDNAAILLSGGMDSAVLVPYIPKGAVAYTIYHEHLEEDNEVDIARTYCKKFNIKHKVIKIDPKDYIECMDQLMVNKKMPLSPAEPIFYLAAKVAVEDGFEQLVTGGGADACFGGFSGDRGDFTIKKYIKKLGRRYINPKKALKHSATIDNILLKYLSPSQDQPAKISNKIASYFKFFNRYKKVDTRRFLREVGYERFAFDNAIGLAGAEHIAPFKEIEFDFNENINKETPKYFIQEIYHDIYGYYPPKKLGLQKPSFLLGDYTPKNFKLFKKDFRADKLPYNEKFLIYCLERFEQLRLDKKVEID